MRQRLRSKPRISWDCCNGFCPLPSGVLYPAVRRGAMRPAGLKVTAQRQLHFASQAYIAGILLALLMVLIALSGTGRGLVG